MEKIQTAKAFTLAEIMIALVVIGVITSILLPVAFNSVPDENVMKFKKGNATLAKVINELASSEQFYSAGDLGKDNKGNWVEDTSYFCLTFSDLVNSKDINCEKLTISTANDIISSDWEYNGTKENDWKLDTALDDICKTSKNKNYVTTADGITYWENDSTSPFGIEDKNTSDRNFYYGKMNTAKCGKDQQADLEEYGDDYVSICYGNGFYYVYKPFCMDIDGIGEGEDPFGYGIRIDGKIILGARAQEWLEKNIQDKD